MLIPEHYRKINDEVFFFKTPIVVINAKDIAFIKQQACQSFRQRARLCAHHDNSDAVHEMIIALTRKSYIHPHKHQGKSESFHIIEGEADVVLLDDEGHISDIIELGVAGSGRAVYYRLDQEIFHTLNIRSDFLVIHEVTTGPFVPAQSELAFFAPLESQVIEAQEYREHIAQRAETYQTSHRN